MPTLIKNGGKKGKQLIVLPAENGQKLWENKKVEVCKDQDTEVVEVHTMEIHILKMQGMVEEVTVTKTVFCTLPR